MFRAPESRRQSLSQEPVHHSSEATTFIGLSLSDGLRRKKHADSSYSPTRLTDDDAKWSRSPTPRQYSTSHGPGPPVTLGPGRTDKVGVDLVLEVLLCASACLASIPFIWLAIAMANFDGKRVTEHDSNFIKQATSTVSTLFTILFAAVVGTTIKRYATWHLGRGVSLGFLEQIMQSRTFFTAATTQIAMGAFNITAMVLLVIWAFSPLGSQACLRLITTRVSYNESSSLISHVDTIENQVFDSESGVSSLLTSLKPTYVATVISPQSIKNSSVDLWGNVKIPWLKAGVEADDDGWVHYNPSEKDGSSYSSLIGVPMANLENQNSTFVIETTYINLDCEKPLDEPRIDINTNISAISNGTFYGPNTTEPNDDFAIYPSWQLALNQFVSSTWGPVYPQLLANLSTTALPPAATLLFQTRFALSRCTPTQIYLESNITCTTQPTSPNPNCHVTSQRPSPHPHAPSTLTTLSFSQPFTSLTSTWILATDKLTSSGFSSLTEYYLQNTSAPSILAGHGRNYANYSNVDATAFSVRLGQLLNTWSLAALVNADTMGGFGLNYKNVTAGYTEGELVYLCDWRWMGVYCVSIAVMVGAAGLAAWCAWRTRVPDVLGYCSSLTRDSRFFEGVVRGGSAMGGLRRARVLGEVRVRLGEARGGVGEVGGEGEGLQGGFRNEIVEGRLGRLVVAPVGETALARRRTLYA